MAEKEVKVKVNMMDENGGKESGKMAEKEEKEEDVVGKRGRPGPAPR